MIKVGSDFSGVGAFDQALHRLGIAYQTIFACDMDKYARETYVENYGEPTYFPTDVYEREIPKESLDIYMTSPPCQAFSMAGKRLGKKDKRGILFFNSHEFIKENKPRFFIFENVRGLLSDDKGNTFQEWINLLGGKSINGLPILFPQEDSVPYHIYYKVLNSKKVANVPQNRDRVFIIGIRDDVDNSFTFPKDKPLTKKLADVLEEAVDDKYFLSTKLVNTFITRPQAKDYKFTPLVEESESSPTVLARYYKCGPTDPYLEVKSATKKGYEIAKEGDSINITIPTSETRRGRVGKGVAQTLDTGCNQATWIADYRNDEGLRIRKDNISPCMTSRRHSETDISTMPALVGSKTNVRRLTPRECFRLMDFPETFTWKCSDTQAYRQAGNSIVVGVLCEIIKKFKL
tara:strand:+ start:4039 stop:5250 length:1212 start_codon:yes stop_codon:yes gene_type:complete